MAEIDVTDLLTDPEFTSTFDVTRNLESVNNAGFATITPTIYPGVVGVVLPAGLKLMRTYDASRMAGAITIYTQFTLLAGAGNNAADNIAYNGRAYTVTSVDDWSQFGNGFNVAICELLTVNP